MITNQQVVNYLRAIEPEYKPLIEQIETEAHKNQIPIIKKEVQGLLRVLLTLKKPQRLLEIGTAVGFSAILMSEYLPPTGEIITLERSPYMIHQAKQNIKKAGQENRITLLEGDALKTIIELKEPFDVIFVDAAKGQYLKFLPYCIKLLKQGGLLVSDNVLQEGSVAKSRYSIERRQRTIHARMRAYLWEINHHPQLETTILPIGDGVTLSYKKS